MIIRVASDLHLEWGNYSFINLPEDKDSVAVLAGDVVAWKHGKADRGWYLLKEMSKQFKAVIYVFGNHEFYHGGDIVEMRNIVREWVSRNELHNVHILENGCVEIGDVAFIGATLWTDYDRDNPVKKVRATHCMADYHEIKFQDRSITPNDLYCLHLESRKYIFDECRRQTLKGNKTVIVTHHGVTEQSISARYKGDYANAYFVSELTDDIIDADPTLMIHGHVHNPFDYKVAPDVCQTRVVVNPRGYVPYEDNGHELCCQIEI